MDYSSGTAVCQRFFKNCGESMKSKLDSPMPWIGMYVAAASAIVSLAMAVDAFNGFRSKRFWFPSKFSTLNAFSLTLIAVAMKLPVDLTNPMLGSVNEILTRVSSLVLMSTIMGNLMTSLGTMGNNDIMLNLAALATLVITIVVNVCINISQMLGNVRTEVRLLTVVSQIYAEQIISIVFMFVMLAMLCSWGIAVPSLRKLIDDRYNNMTEFGSRPKVELGNVTVDRLKRILQEYWINVKAGINPQFVIARSETSAAAGIMCALIALSLLEAWIRLHFQYKGGVVTVAAASSNYKWSINWILFVQSIGVGLGTIAPLFRWYVAAKFKSIDIFSHSSFKKYFEIESYWTALLREWRATPLPLVIRRHPKFRKLVNDAKRVVLSFSIAVQVVIVLGSKIVLFISAVCIKLILLCFQHEGDTIDYGIFDFIPLLEGPMLTKEAVQKMRDEVNEMIQKGQKKQHRNLIELLQKSVNFNGVKEFVDNNIGASPNYHPDSWFLSIVTLTSIAIQLPNITPGKIDELLKGVGEGLYFVKKIEKSLLRGHQNSETYMKAANNVWIGVQVPPHKWQGISLKSQTSYKNTLQELFEIAEHKLYILKGKLGSWQYWDYQHWPLEEIAASSMFHISKKLLHQSNMVDNDGETEEELFERLSIMISDILFACLTNLVSLITFKCSYSDIKEREKNVREAALLTSEITQKILGILQQRDILCPYEKRQANIAWWRHYLSHNEY